MRILFLAALALIAPSIAPSIALSSAGARAEVADRGRADCGAEAWYRRAQSVIRWLEGVQRPDRDGLIVPPEGLDPKMVLVPREPAGRSPVIPPPGSPGGDRTLRPK